MKIEREMARWERHTIDRKTDGMEYGEGNEDE
jgi:hypothetical protein